MSQTFRSLGLMLAAVVLALAGMAVSSPGVTMAATTTITIPLTTLSVGSHTFGPAALDTTVTDAHFSIDRTAGSKSLNTRPSSVTMELDIQASFDGGVTWFTMCSHVTPGGTVPDDYGNPTLTDYIDCPLPTEGSTNRMAKATVVITGAQVSVSGSLTLS